ncbi:MAG: DUF6328 family protein [Chitinispirillaceae bacterium]
MDEREKVPKTEAVKYLLQESRMILPGLQVLFGFQLIVVFNGNFYEFLSYPEQILHVIAMGLVAVAITLVIAPAAFLHYQGERMISDRFINMSSWLMSGGMVPLSIAVVIEFYLVIRVVINIAWVSFVSAAVLAILTVFFWFLLPRIHARRVNHL